jgi:acyl transferase domain-containing protein/3-hydroxymyristoyl/3-hydroxydecanoyl-(acyl carrier protein) dehydratase
MTALDRVAIVGVGGLFPGAGADLQAFWNLIESGQSAAREVPASRWILDVEDIYQREQAVADKVFSRRGCFLDEFDSTPLNDLDIDTDWLKTADPLFTLGLRAAQLAMNDVRSQKLPRQRMGVTIGNIVLPTDHSSRIAEEVLGSIAAQNYEPLTATKTQLHPFDRCLAGLPGGLIARAFGLGAGARTLDAACASSLYALKLAVDDLLAGRVDAMLAGGLSRPACLYTQMGFSQLRALSENGVCSPFDEAGNGLVVGEGAGMFVLKRLSDALADGDHIYGVIHGIGLSNDTAGSLLAPDIDGQLRAMAQAYKEAQWKPSDVQLVECHATGTPVGDSVEFRSLRRLWGEEGWEDGQCVIGSVKSNVGHLLTGAGAAGLMKVLLAFQEKTLPPTAHFRRLPESLGKDPGPLRVLGKAQAWECDSGVKRRAAVSAFGFGGINAHVLVEQWQPESAIEAIEIEAIKSDDVLEIAVVGMDAQFGSLSGLKAFEKQALTGARVEATKLWAAQPELQEAARRWLVDNGMEDQVFYGYTVDEILVPLGRFRIPPNELREMLPQQLLMLIVAAGALDDAELKREDLSEAGVFIGIGIDHKTSNFHLRWSMRPRSENWLTDASIESSDAWLLKLREACGPALSANRTMGALGGIVASRVAREFAIGGPSFTVSSDDSSGLRALEIGARLLQRGDISHAIVGAVDLCADVRSVLLTHAQRRFSSGLSIDSFGSKSAGTLPGEGAGAVVLKRLDDAKRDGDRIYSIIRGLGVSTSEGSESGLPEPSSDALIRAMKASWREAKISADDLSFIECHGSGDRGEDAIESRALEYVIERRDNSELLALGSAAQSFGHSGAASGLLSLIRGSLALYNEIIPGFGLKKQEAAFQSAMTESLSFSKGRRYWLRNRLDGPRRLGLNNLSVDGNCTHVVLQESETKNAQSPLREMSDQLFRIEADNEEKLQDFVKQLSLQLTSGGSLRQLAISWNGAHPASDGRRYGLGMIAGSIDELKSVCDRAESEIREAFIRLRGGALKKSDLIRRPRRPDQERLFFSADGLGTAGKLAFVYPGSGNHFPGMGQDLAAAWPELMRRQDQENERLRDQLSPDEFWSGKALKELNDQHRELILGQVSLGTIVTDWIREFVPDPKIAIGYSLGESAALFGLRAWPARDEMLRRVKGSSLFVNDMAGRCDAVRAAWKLDEKEVVDWHIVLVNRPAGIVKKALEGRARVYLLIVNTHEECVIGGDRGAVEDLVKDLDCHHLALEGITTVHCEVAEPVKAPYLALHQLPTVVPETIEFYSGASGESYALSEDAAANSILAQAIHGVNFPAVIENAYNNGARVFLEIGPGASCSRMIRSVLGDRPHMTRALMVPDEKPQSILLRLLAQLIAERVPVKLDSLYQLEEEARPKPKRSFTIPLTLPLAKDWPALPERSVVPGVSAELAESVTERRVLVVPVSAAVESYGTGHPVGNAASNVLEPVIVGVESLEQSRSRAHDAFLRTAQSLSRQLGQQISLQMSFFQQLAHSGDAVSLPEATPSVTAYRRSVSTPCQDAPIKVIEAVVQSAQISDKVRNPVLIGPEPVLDYSQCLEFGIGLLANCLGEEFAEADQYPTRVRLPDEPLMLCHRIMTIEGEALSMSSGRVVTEHDVVEGAWYLDNGRMPTCIAVEAGQADLFLAGYLGIDLETKGLAAYRLLDAVVTFHRALPGPGEIIQYDIKIDEFFRQGSTYLFRFNFESTVNGERLLSMGEGCAGFFTEAELSAGQGIIHTKFDKRPIRGKRPADWTDLVGMPVSSESYSADQVHCLRCGDLAGCFGAEFAGLPLSNPTILPGQRFTGDRMRLLDRVVELNPTAGRFGLGQISAELDIKPDDWFLTCHFVDDQVMPGTLMYECCMHTLRIYLMRMGWVGEQSDFVTEPVPGVASRLKCRGQVLAQTKVTRYQVSIKEIGYEPAPYVIADALMFADGKAIVEITDMSIRLSGLSRERLEDIWSGQTAFVMAPEKTVLFDNESILAFALGKPSEAFGDRYTIFDEDRKIARLPGPPYKFLDRITVIEDCEPWVLSQGAYIEGEYDVPVDEWYFSANQGSGMPFSVLLEIALQPCGWLAGYLGSALTSETDLRFRNLGGKATQHRIVLPDCGTLAVHITMTNFSNSGGMIIQHFSMEVYDSHGLVYKGTTYFGFFSAGALATQLGIRDVIPYQPEPSELVKSKDPFAYPVGSPLTDEMLSMVDMVTVSIADGGPAGLGFIRGTKAVNPDEWFFKAHFYEDPVCPGSLGLESFIQLIKLLALERWGQRFEQSSISFETMALGLEHEWVYRGQVVPNDRQVTVQAIVTEIDDGRCLLKADGHLIVDGRIIYGMKNFSLMLHGVEE